MLYIANAFIAQLEVGPLYETYTFFYIVINMESTINNYN